MFKSNSELLESLQKAYNNDVDNIDLYIGGMLESNDGPGELFTAIIREQFIRLRQADRFWFENVDNGLVSVLNLCSSLQKPVEITKFYCVQHTTVFKLFIPVQI